MNPHDNDPLHAAINAKLAAIVEASPTTPAWHDAWTGLGPESTEEERLAVYQAVRDSGCLPAEAGFYLVSWQIDAMASQDAEISLCHLDEQMKAIEEAYGLEEGEFWPPGQGPPGIRRASPQYHAAWDGIFAEKLEEFGEHEMARQFRADPEEFHRRSKAGQEFFHGPEEPEESDAPEWMYALADTVAGSMTAAARAGWASSVGRRRASGRLSSTPSPSNWSAAPTTAKSWPPVSRWTWRSCGASSSGLTRSPGSRWGFPTARGRTCAIEGVYQGHAGLRAGAGLRPRRRGAGDETGHDTARKR